MATKLDNEACRSLARWMNVLSVATRVRIIQLLKGRALCVNALAARLGVTAGAVSQHLRILRDADLVSDERRGYFVHYRLRAETLAAWRKEIDGLLAPYEETTVYRKGGAECVAMKRRKAAGNRKT